MDYFGDIDSLSKWITEYGSLSLFFALILGIVAFPVPEETLMVMAGMLIYNEKVAVYPTLVAAYGGSICGITISYFVGRTAGHYVIHKYGGWIGFTEQRIQKVHNWFEKFGTWMLFIGYFIPGVRHFTGFCAGTTDLEYRRFALFAYTGAIFWVSTFVSLGYFFGTYWSKILNSIQFDVDNFFVILILLSTLVLFWRLKKKYVG